MQQFKYQLYFRNDFENEGKTRNREQCITRDTN